MVGETDGTRKLSTLMTEKNTSSFISIWKLLLEFVLETKKPLNFDFDILCHGSK